MEMSDSEIKSNKSKKIFLFTFILIVLGIVFLIIFLNKKEEIELMEEVIYLKVGEIKALPYKVSENNNKKIIFESKDDKIARIDSQGYIFAIKQGETYVSAKFEEEKDNLKKCKVIVTIEQEDNTKDDNEHEEKPVSPPVDTPTVVKPTCKLSVSKDGIITAKPTNALKYGFVKNNLDNVLMMNIKDIANKDVKDYEGWKYYKINYYVEAEDGTLRSCSIVVIEKCNKETNVCIYEKN